MVKALPTWLTWPTSSFFTPNEFGVVKFLGIFYEYSHKLVIVINILDKLISIVYKRDITNSKTKSIL